MVDSQIVQEWVDKADEDFDFAHINLKEGKSFFHPNLLPFPAIC